MSNQHRGRRSYKQLNAAKVWGAYDENGKLVGTCKARTQELAYLVFSEHNKRNPEFKIEGAIREVV